MVNTVGCIRWAAEKLGCYCGDNSLSSLSKIRPLQGEFAKHTLAYGTTGFSEIHVADSVPKLRTGQLPDAQH